MVSNPPLQFTCRSPILWELILRKEVSQVSSNLISWKLVSGLCGFTFQAWEAAKGNGSGLYYFGSCLDNPPPRTRQFKQGLPMPDLCESRTPGVCVEIVITPSGITSFQLFIYMYTYA